MDIMLKNNSIEAHACVHAVLKMARYCYIVYGFDPTDGVWERLGGRFPTRAMARQFIRLFHVEEEYDVIDVVRSIRF